MNSMPLLVRIVAMLLIGMPGGILWVGGMISLLLSCWGLLERPASERLQLLISVGASLAATVIGFAMVSCVEIFNGSKRYRMTGARLIAYLGLELLEGLLVIASVCVALNSIRMFAKGEPFAGIFWTFCVTIVVVLLIATRRTRRSKERIWRAELITQAPPPDLEAGS